MNRRTFLGSLALPFLAGVVDRVFAQQTPAAPAVPPVSYSCPMHAEVVDNKPGKCPICGMVMTPVRLAFVWSCPVHSDLTKQAAGKCPRCGRDLVRVTKALTFTCRVHPKVDVLDPGKCPICKRTLVEQYSIRPHGDHNPKHGGYFFMASNNWHIEVTHPAIGLFRLYVYDEYSKPFHPPGLEARVVEVDSPDGRTSQVSAPFTGAVSAPYHVAKVPGLALPATIAIQVRFETGDKAYPFNFVFYDYSKEPTIRR